MPKHKKKAGPESYVPRMFIVLPCGLHACEAYRGGAVSGKPIDRSLVPHGARTCEEDRPCKICNPPPPWQPADQGDVNAN
jgi:hypothetical protein